MGKREPKRHPVHKRRDPKRRLRGDETGEDEREPCAPPQSGIDERKRQNRVSQHPMVELNERDVLERVCPPGRG